MNKPYLIILLLSILISCDSSDDSSDNEGGNNPSEAIRLTEIKLTAYYNGKSIINLLSYQYDENYRIEQAISENENGIFTTNYFYTGDNITSLEYSNGSSRSYIYENELVISSTHSSRIFLYEYNSSQQMIQQSEYIGQDLLCTKNFQYDNNDNPILSEDPCNGFTIEFDYDSKNNPFGALLPNNFLKVAPHGKNNAITYANEVYSNGETITYITTSSMEYNSDDYPTKIMYYNEAGELKSMEEYFYE